MRFVRASLPGDDAIPRTPSGMPLDMAHLAWGPDRYVGIIGATSPEQTGRHTSRPAIAFGRRFPGVQRKNGVAQLDPGWEIPATPGSFSPYWQTAARVNPPTFLRGNASPYPPQGPYQVAAMFPVNVNNVGAIGPTSPPGS